MMAPMTTKAELAVHAASVNAEALAEAAGISTKTVYRIRQQKANPSLQTVEDVLRAVAEIKARPTPPIERRGGDRRCASRQVAGQGA